ncbi:MAG: cell division protein ZapE, partial [Rhizobiales bacterium]|nr:cell division protein ZapE [Hyphomicrobiales bacterium]
DAADRNAAKRFIALIDTLYDNAVKLVASADADPMSLYSATEGTEAMEFQRTVSRLIEMGSESYLALPHGRSDSTASGASTGLVETCSSSAGIGKFSTKVRLERFPRKV